MKKSMKRYSDLITLKSYMKGAAAFNELDGVQNLSDEQWEELFDYTIELGEALEGKANDHERIKYLIEGILLHTLIDIMEGNYQA